MTRLRAETRTRVGGSRDAWSLAAPRGRSDAASRESQVEAEISRDERQGYPLLLAPEGCSSADSDCPTLAATLELARELLGLEASDWT